MPSASTAIKSATRHGQVDLNSPALNGAFEALKTYDQGSSRAALLPIDEAVIASLDDKVAQKELERQLVNAVTQSGLAAAREYLCSKLTLIGSKSAVTALAALLGAPETATAARTALEAIPGRQATKALRESLSNVEGLQKIGVINSLGARRDAESVRALTGLLKNADPETAGAAAAAMGDIGSAKAAKSLRDYQPNAPAVLREKVADACLVCAERLLVSGRRADAQVLYRMLATGTQSKHVQYAAASGLDLASGKPAASPGGSRNQPPAVQ